MLDAWHGKEKFSEEMAARTGVPGRHRPLPRKTKTVYDLTEEVFLQNSLHKLKTFHLAGVPRLPQLRKDRRFRYHERREPESLQRSPHGEDL